MGRQDQSPGSLRSDQHPDDLERISNASTRPQWALPGWESPQYLTALATLGPVEAGDHPNVHNDQRDQQKTPKDRNFPHLKPPPHPWMREVT
jgi:hypothetical protein